MDLTEAEVIIKKRWQEYTEELCKKDLHNPDNHNGIVRGVCYFLGSVLSQQKFEATDHC